MQRSGRVLVALHQRLLREAAPRPPLHRNIS